MAKIEFNCVCIERKSKHVILKVNGEKPSSNTDVKLTPMVYATQPDYWQIAVTGGPQGTGTPAFTPYSVELDITKSIGTKGIAVQGVSNWQIDIKP